MKKLTLSAIRKKVWAKYSLMCRLQEAGKDGCCVCVACAGEGKMTKGHYKTMHASHFVPKSMGLAIMFERRNVATCCVGCNMFKHGNLSAYAVWLKDKYGESIFDELMAIRNYPPMGAAASRQFLEEVLAETENTLKTLL